MLKDKGFKTKLITYVLSLKIRVKLIFISNEILQYAKKHSTFENLQRNYVIAREWNKCVQLIRNGQYELGVKKQKEILQELYSQKFFTNNGESPMFYSHHWGTRFGHLGALGMKIKFDEITLEQVPLKKMFIKNESLFDKFKPMLNNFIDPVYNQSLLNFELPSNWAEFDLLDMVRHKGDFIEHNAMHEFVFKSGSIDQNTSALKDSRTRDEVLTCLGLELNDWYVALHIRNVKFPYDERKVDQNKFNEAVTAIIEAGGHVIQFGENMTKIQGFDSNKVKLLSEIQGAENLDLSVLSKAKFCLASASGPTSVAMALGVPVLQTDSVAICLHVKSASKGSLYLPKKVLRKDKVIKYSELAETGLGYRHVSLKDWEKESIVLEENNSSEIRDATLEMLNSEKLESEFSSSIQNIRSDYNILGHGKFSESYLESNSWLSS